MVVVVRLPRHQSSVGVKDFAQALRMVDIVLTATLRCATLALLIFFTRLVRSPP